MSNVDYERLKNELAEIDAMAAGSEKLIKLLDYKKRLITCGSPTPFMHVGYPGLLEQTNTALAIEEMSGEPTGSGKAERIHPDEIVSLAQKGIIRLHIYRS